MRYLKHIQNGTVWPWTEQLAKRSDMMEVHESVVNANREKAKAVAAKPKQEPKNDQKPAETPEAQAKEDAVAVTSANDEIDAITNKDDMKAFAAEHGIAVDARKTLEVMKEIVREALG